MKGRDRLITTVPTSKTQDSELIESSLRAAITRVTLVAGFAGTLAFPLGHWLGQVMGGLTGGGAAAPAAAGGLGGLASMLDFDGDGNPLDDIMGMAAKLTR